MTPEQFGEMVKGLQHQRDEWSEIFEKEFPNWSDRAMLEISEALLVASDERDQAVERIDQFKPVLMEILRERKVLIAEVALKCTTLNALLMMEALSPEGKAMIREQLERGHKLAGAMKLPPDITLEAKPANGGG